LIMEMPLYLDLMSRGSDLALQYTVNSCDETLPRRPWLSK
jgi:hypothetical protein